VAWIIVKILGHHVIGFNVLLKCFFLLHINFIKKQSQLKLTLYIKYEILIRAGKNPGAIQTLP